MCVCVCWGERGGVDSERKSQVARAMGNRHIKECMANYKLSPKCTEMQYNSSYCSTYLFGDDFLDFWAI